MAREEGRLHIVMLPWFAFGHMIPFFHLAVALANAGLRVSLLSTPRNTRRLPHIPPHLKTSLRFVDLPLPPVDGLPDNAEATVDVTPEEGRHLITAYDLLRQPIKQLLAHDPPDFVIHDVIPYWIVPIAQELGAPRVVFSVFSTAVIAFFGPPEATTEEGRKRWWPSPASMTKPPEWVTFPSTVAFRSWEAEEQYKGTFGAEAATGMRFIDRKQMALEGCAAIAARSCREYEAPYIELLGRLMGKPVIPIGLLPPAVEAGVDSAGGEVFDWLNARRPESVVFVGFGSECRMSRDQIHELAHGLEISKLPFLWALRRPAWVSDDGQDEDALPEGFAARTKAQGFVTFGWAPQMKILAHPAIGGCLFHSGWGTAIECLCFGHALVVLPLIFDQGLNARLLVEKGLAVEAERGDDGSFNRDQIASALRTAMASAAGDEVRARAREMQAVFADQALHDKYVREFVDYLLQAKAAQGN